MSLPTKDEIPMVSLAQDDEPHEQVSHQAEGEVHSEGPGPIKDQLKKIATENYFNVLLVLIPFAIASSYAGWPKPVIFILNFLCMVPLAALLGMATEELANYTNATIGGLLNATFGNAVELIVAIIALKEDLFFVVKASLLGSILSNLLFVLGFSFLFGGFKYPKQTFGVTAAQTSSGILMFSVLTIAIPAVFVNTIPVDATISAAEVSSRVLKLSHGAAIINFTIYFMYLFFQIKTHRHLFEGEGEEEEKNLSLPVAIALLIVVTIFVSWLGELLVGSIEDTAKSWGMSPTFISVILLPIVGNAAEHMTAVTMAMKNKMEISIGVVIGSSTQIAVFTIPAITLLAWPMGKAFTLNLMMFETFVLLMSVLVVNIVIADGESHWLEGVVLLGSYLIIAMAFFFYPISGEVYV